MTRIYVQLKSREANIRGTAEQVGEAYQIRAIELLRDEFPHIAERYVSMLQEGDYMSSQISGTARRMVALKDTGTVQ